jgi:hypothetical protein
LSLDEHISIQNRNAKAMNQGNNELFKIAARLRLSLESLYFKQQTALMLIHEKKCALRHIDGCDHIGAPVHQTKGFRIRALLPMAVVRLAAAWVAPRQCQAAAAQSAGRPAQVMGPLTVALVEQSQHCR